MARVPKLLDVSVPLVAGMPAYPGNPEFELQPVKRIADGGSSNVSRLVMGTHTGTHVDAPQAFFRRRRRGRCAAARSAARPRARGRDPETRRHRRRRARGGRPARRPARPAEDARIPRSGTADGFHAGLHATSPKRARGTSSIRASRSIGVDYLSVEQFKKAGAPAHRALLSQRRRDHRRAESLRSGTGHVRDVLPAAARAGGDGAPARVILKR